jgi:hypothetical protein
MLSSKFETSQATISQKHPHQIFGIGLGTP